ncbi:aldo/keto reductase [bacterium]|nr:aldo/keto reductase [bacterium]
MKYGNIPGLEKPVSRLCQGAIMLDPANVPWGMEVLDSVYAQGCNTFDTGHIYGNGSSERLLGQWISERGLRDKVNILTKGCHHNPDRKRVTPYDLTADLMDSLARMKVDTIDVYVLHRDDPEVEVGPIVETLNQHLEAGRIRAFGGSNWTSERIGQANAYANAHGLVPFALSSPNYSLAEMVESPWGEDCVSLSGPQNEAAREWYKGQNMPLFTWSSLARGFFAGNIGRDNFEGMKAVDRSSIKAYCHEVNFKRLDRVSELAKEKGLTIPQIAMAYVANTPLNIFGLVGCYSGKEFQECLEAWDVTLTAEEMAWLDLRSESR